MTQTSSPIVIAYGLRMPQARAGGVFKNEDAAHLGARLVREVLARTNLDPNEIGQVFTGCTGPPSDQANVSRVLALRAGIPEHVPAVTLARNCASGMEAVTNAATWIKAGEGDLAMCVGVEVMSRYPLMFNRKMTGLFSKLMTSRSLLGKLQALSKFRLGHLAPVVGITEGLTDSVSGMIMGSTAELLARDFDISRAESDGYACRSHERARDARERGRFADEILPHLALGSKKGSSSLLHDDSIRDQQTVEALAKMRPYFEKPDGTVTIGNSCGITDSATALIVTTEEKAHALGLKPLARLRSFAWAGLDPKRMGLGPVHATSKALTKAGCNLSDIGAIELNEAFAVQVLACKKAFESDSFAREHLGRDRAVGELDLALTNKNGGAIALGHPVGATGARIILTAAHELRESNCELSLATLCIGGGQGGAVILERMAS